MQRQDQDAPLPGDELNTHPACVHLVGAVRTNRQKGYRNSVPPRDATGDAFELDDAAVLTPVVSGVASSAASLAVFAGVVALADFAGILFPAIAGMEFLAVAEDLSLADDAGGLPPAVRVSEPLRPAAGAGPLSDVEATPSVELWGLVWPSSSHASRGDNEDGSPSDIVIESEPMVCPGVGASPTCLPLPSRVGALWSPVTGMRIGVAG